MDPICLCEHPSLATIAGIKAIKISVVGTDIKEAVVKNGGRENVFCFRSKSNLPFPCHRTVFLIQRPQYAHVASEIYALFVNRRAGFWNDVEKISTLAFEVPLRFKRHRNRSAVFFFFVLEERSAERIFEIIKR